MKGLFHLLLTFQVFINIFAYNFSCPGPGQWKFRSSQICPGDKKKYVCLYDVINKRIAENCNGPQIEQQGDKTVINIHNRLNTEKCSEDRYQPEAFTTIGNSKCVYEKSPCSDDGQVLLNNGSGKEDRSCRCDYRRGYAFVSMTRSDPCSCVPSQEDCSCYLKHCGDREMLSQDYECVGKTDLNRMYDCSVIEGNESTKQTEKERSKGRPSVAVDRPQYFVIYGDSAKLHCVVTLDTKSIYWQKSQDEQIYNITEYTNKYSGFSTNDPSLIINDADSLDEANYTCYGNSDAGISHSLQTELLVLEKYYHQWPWLVVIAAVLFFVISVLLCKEKQIDEKIRNHFTKFSFILPLKETICVKHYSVTFECKVSKYGMCPKWFKDDEEICATAEDAKYILTADRGMYTLTIKKTEISDTGTYSVYFKNQQSSSACLIVLGGMSEKEYYFYKVFKLMRKVAEPIVRMQFNSAIHPEKLSATLAKERPLLEKLKGSKQISWTEYDLLFPRKVKYKVSFVLSEKNFSEDLENNNSYECKVLKEDIKKNISELYSEIQGRLEVEDVAFFQPKFWYVTLEFKSRGSSEDEQLKAILSSAVTNQKIPPFSVCDTGLRIDSDSVGGKFKATVLFCNLDEKDENTLKDETSKDRNSLYGNVENSVSNLYTEAPGPVNVKVIDFKHAQILGVSFVLTSKDYYNEKKIREVLECSLNEQLTYKIVKSSFSFQFFKNENLTPTSKNFDIRLLILLLRNIVKYDIQDTLPAVGVTSVEADLSRIKFYRNQITHDKREMTKSEYEEIWNGLYDPLLRLGKEKYTPFVIGMKMRKTASQRLLFKLKKQFSSSTNIQEESQVDDEVDSGDDCQLCELQNEKFRSPKDEIAYLLNRLVDRAAKVKFDKEFPPTSLKQSITNKTHDLEELQRAKKLTPKQWEYLFPHTGIPKSENIDFTLRIRLMWILKGTMKKKQSITDDDYKDFGKLRDLTDGLNKLSYTEEEQQMIIKILRRLGGDNYLHIYDRQESEEDRDSARC